MNINNTSIRLLINLLLLNSIYILKNILFLKPRLYSSASQLMQIEFVKAFNVQKLLYLSYFLNLITIFKSLQVFILFTGDLSMVSPRLYTFLTINLIVLSAVINLVNQISYLQSSNIPGIHFIIFEALKPITLEIYTIYNNTVNIIS